MRQTLLSLLMALLPLTAAADAVEIGGIYYNLTLEGKVAEVTKNPNKYTGVVEIPESVEYGGVTCVVTSIGESAFYKCSGLTSVIIPNSITAIGEHAFQLCSGLTSVSIPNSVTSIGYYAFEGCTGLTSVAIPNSVASIGGWFRDCSGLISVTIPNSVTSIGPESFEGCTGLTSVTIPNSVTNIGYYAFQRCTSLTSVTIPNSVTTICDYAFQSCIGLTSITIPESVTSIGDGAFYYCDNLLTVRSEITEPFNCKRNVFSKNTLRNGVLYVPASTKELYIRFDGWREFLRIEETGGETVEYVWLTMKDGRGITKLKVKKGTRQELSIQPEAGWKILTATMDGTDISSLIKSCNVYTTPAIMNDATISIVYEKDNTSDTFSARQSKADIKVVDDGVVIYNAEPQSRCIVYGANGLPVANSVITNSTHKITLPKGQVYLLALGDRTLKFAL